MGCAAVGLGCAGRCEGANRIWGVWGGLQLWDWHTQEDVEVLTWDRGAEGCTGRVRPPVLGCRGMDVCSAAISGRLCRAVATWQHQTGFIN